MRTMAKWPFQSNSRCSELRKRNVIIYLKYLGNHFKRGNSVLTNLTIIWEVFLSLYTWHAAKTPPT